MDCMRDLVRNFEGDVAFRLRNPFYKEGTAFLLKSKPLNLSSSQPSGEYQYQLFGVVLDIRSTMSMKHWQCKSWLLSNTSMMVFFPGIHLSRFRGY